MALTGLAGRIGARAAIALAVAVALNVVPPAAAATADELAQQLFAKGVEAARQNRWSEARTSFEAAYGLAPRTVVLINLAGAQARTGLLTEALENYQRVIETSTSPETAEFRKAAATVLPSLQARVPRIRLSSTGIGPSDVVEIDGQQIPGDSIKQPRPVDPGPHTIVVKRSGVERARVAFALAEGETHDVSLPAPVPAVPVPPAAALVSAPDASTSAPEHRRPWWKSPWVWAATATALAVTAVTLVAVEQRPQPFAGNVPPGLLNVP